MFSLSIMRWTNYRHGKTVYRTFGEAMALLAELAAAPPSWWTPSCGEFVSSMEEMAKRPHFVAKDVLPYAHDVMCFEGLDGVGKTTITRHIAQSIGATLIVSPDPRWAPARAAFRQQSEEVTRAFYSACNYFTGDDVVRMQKEGPVVLDRWFLSTLCAALAHRGGEIPPRGDDVYAWPADLPTFSPGLGFLLTVPEEVRVARTRKRGALEADEKVLEANEELRKRFTRAYEHTQRLTTIERPNWRAAVNAIYEVLRRNSNVVPPADFTPEEVAEISPF